MLDDTEVVRPGRSAVAPVLATAALVGIAGFLSIRANVPSVSSPFALLTTLPAVWIFARAQPLASLPIVLGFLMSSPHLLRRTTVIPRRSAVTLFAFMVVNAAWFLLGWSYGIEYQGLSHVLYVAAWNVVFIGAALTLLLINSRTPRFEINLAFHGTVFVWLAWCALPWLGEMP